jgi:hypothetical protein
MPEIKRNRQVRINGLTLTADVLVFKKLPIFYEPAPTGLRAGTYYRLVGDGTWFRDIPEQGVQARLIDEEQCEYLDGLLES